MRSGLQSVRVLVLEDDGPTLARLCRALGSSPLGIEVVWQGATGAAALAWLDRGAPLDVALVDLGLPDVAGPAIVRRIARRRPDTPILVLTVFDDVETVRSVLEAGATGYLVKHVKAEPLAGAVMAAARGASPMTPHIARILLDAWRDRAVADAADPLDALTPREHDVLSRLARGLTYAAVAAELGIGLGTVQGYVKNVYGKLHVHSKAEAMARAKRLGLTS